MQWMDCEPDKEGVDDGQEDRNVVWPSIDFLSLRSLLRCCEPARIHTGGHTGSQDEPPPDDVDISTLPRHKKNTCTTLRFLCEVDRIQAASDYRAHKPFAVGLKKSTAGEPVLLVANKAFEKLFGTLPEKGLALRSLLGPATKAADRDRLLESIRGDGEREVGSLLMYGKSPQEGKNPVPVEARTHVRSLKDTRGYGTFFGMRLDNVETRDVFYVRYCQTTNQWLEHDVKYKHEKSSVEDKVDRTVGLASRMLMQQVRKEVKEEQGRLAFDPYVDVDTAKDVQIKSHKGKRTIDKRTKLQLVKDVKHGVRDDGVLRRCNLQSFGIKETLASATNMETLQQVSNEWVAGHHELFNPIRDQGSYSVEVVPGGLQVPVKMSENFGKLLETTALYKSNSSMQSR